VPLDALFAADVFKDLHGRACLMPRGELPATWNPATDRTATVWECVQHTARVLAAEDGGAAAAASLVARMGPKAREARLLSERLFLISTQKGWASEALVYNQLAQEWAHLEDVAMALMLWPRLVRRPKVHWPSLAGGPHDHRKGDAFQRVQGGLYHLRRGLTPFVEARMTPRHGANWLHYSSRAQGGLAGAALDEYALLKTMIDNWREVFDEAFGRNEKHRVRNFTSMALEARNATSHLTYRSRTTRRCATSTRCTSS